MIAAMLLAVAALQTPAAPPSPTVAAPVTTLYVITYAQGPNWIAGVPMARQRLAGHFRYMQQLLKDNVLVGGGPFTGENAGMALVRAPDPAGARAIVAADPAVREGVFTATVRAWEVRIGGARPLGS